MKKVFLVLAMVICSSLNLPAQELTKQMFNIYYGNPKTLVQSSSVSPESVTVEFDRSGRVLSKTAGSGAMVYNWASDGKKVEVKLYNDGQYVAATMVYIEEMSDTRCKYTADGVVYDILYRSNGSINKMTMSAGGQSMTRTYYYNSFSDVFPVRIVSAGGGQSMSINVSGIRTDAEGNCIEYTQSAQGQSMKGRHTILYY